MQPNIKYLLPLAHLHCIYLVMREAIGNLDEVVDGLKELLLAMQKRDGVERRLILQRPVHIDPVDENIILHAPEIQP